MGLLSVVAIVVVLTALVVGRRQLRAKCQPNSSQAVAMENPLHGGGEIF
jgi:hypothetical protein